MPEAQEQHGAQQKAERSTRRVLLGWVVGVIIALLLALLALRVFIRPMNPLQEPPEFHFGEPCWACHLVTDDAELVDAE